MHRRLKDHAQSKDFDSFSFVRLGRVHRDLVEDFLVSAIHPLPGERMKVDLLNQNPVPEYLEDFWGIKSAYDRYRIET